jgi:modification methylase
LATMHQIFLEDAHAMAAVEDCSVHLLVTSPPYPMIEMWDAHFSAFNIDVAEALNRSDGDRAFELMHQDLDGIWREVLRVLAPGAIACINIGDATRTVDGKFRLFPNHARIISAFQSLGFSQLPTIIWRKTTNAPNKFMGSGMMPPGAYVTLEHEYILIFRKGPKRQFPDELEKQTRRQSAYFWEERNLWFSDVWTGLPGTVQSLNNTESRRRSAAFPLELPYRLINMFSIQGDTVLDPFLGSGTTMLAAMCAGRNCLGYEIDRQLQQVLLGRLAAIPDASQDLVQQRLAAHLGFVKERTLTKSELKYVNKSYDIPVMTRQEVDLCFQRVESIQFHSGSRFNVDYTAAGGSADQSSARSAQPGDPRPPVRHAAKGHQLKLF